jgi:hypothetical protein
VVEAFAPQGADEAFRDRLRPRRSDRAVDDPDVRAGEHRVEGGVNVLSRSRIKKRNWAAWSPRSMSRLRACWVTHASDGVGGNPGDVYAAAVVLEHDQQVEAA